MPRKILNSQEKISATVIAFILSLSFFSFVTTPSANAWSSAQTTVSVFGATSTEAGNSVAVDSSGNIYTTGYFNGTVDFDPGAGTFNLTVAGGQDVFVSKLDSSGNFLWAKSFGGSSTDDSLSITVDSTENVYTTGYFQGTADFDPGAATSNLISSGGFEAFVSKLDSSGNFVWAKKMGGAANEFAYSIAVDNSGNVYSTGMFEGTADFDPGAGTFNLTSAGGYDAYISKLDLSGNFLWAKSFEGTNTGYANDAVVDSSGDIYITGSVVGTVDFDPGAGTFNLTAANGAQGSFVSKIDSSGDFVWAKGFGLTSFAYTESVKLDSSGNIYTTGSFFGTANFDPGAGTFNLTSAGSGDIFVSKLDSSGNFLWAKSFGGSSDDFGYSVSIDSSGNIFTTGYFAGTADFDPGDGITNLTSAGNRDVFVSKLNSSGALLWAKSFGGSSNDTGESIAVDSTGNVYTTGVFRNTTDFDPGAGSTNFTSAGGGDVFVLKLSPSGEAEASTAPAAPTLNSVTAGDRRVTISFTAGANNGAAITDYEYSLNGGSYTSAGTTTSPITITGLSGRTAYSVTIKARNSAGLSTASSSLTATTTDASRDSSEAAAEAARVAAAAEAAKKAKEQKELTELLSVIPSIAGLALNLGDLTNSVLTTKCVKGKTVKNVKKGAKCPKGYVKKK
jgi:hypothetical protein